MQQLTYIVSGTADAQRKAESAKEKLERIPHVESLLVTIAAPCEMPMEEALRMRDDVRSIFPKRGFWCIHVHSRWLICASIRTELC